MTKLQLLLREYVETRYAHDDESSRYFFNTEKDRFLFVKRLAEINAEFMLFGKFRIEVFNCTKTDM
jgi:hypothetical protein